MEEPETTPKFSRSTKPADPPKFHNEPDRDDVGFEMWFRQIRDKIGVNKDHYPDTASKRIYVVSRLAGIAAKNVEPYLKHTHPCPILTYEALMDHLWESYSNPNELEEAVEEYESLKMKPSDLQDFPSFKNTFVRLAASCHRPKDSWKYDLKRRLVPNLQNHLMAAYLDKSVTFEGYARLAQELALTMKHTYNSRSPRRNENNSRNENDKNWNDKLKPKGKEGTTKSLAKSSGTKLPPRPTNVEDYKLLISEGRCFTCRELGPRQGDCPLRTKEKADKAARIEAIANKFAKLDSDDESGNE